MDDRLFDAILARDSYCRGIGSPVTTGDLNPIGLATALEDGNNRVSVVGGLNAITRGTNRRRLRKVGLAALPILGAMAATLQGCDDRQADRAPVPEFVQQMMSVDFPADGQAHVQARGTFRITPRTALCTFRPGWGLDTPQVIEALPRMRQQYRNAQAGIGEECLQGQPVFVLARPVRNRLGSHYKVILAVWQGEAAWTGAIERLNGARPEFKSARPFRDGLPPLTPWARKGFEREDRDHRAELSIRRDMAFLSQAVLNRIVKDSE